MTHGRKLTIALFLPLLLAMPVAAQTSAVCETLLDQLASTPEVIGNMAGARRYSSALTQQNMQIRQLRNEMRRMGCSSGSIVVFGGDHRAECGDMQSDLERMEDDKLAIADQRDAALGRDNSDARNSILAALETNGCTGDGRSQMDRPDDNADSVPDYRQFKGFDRRAYEPLNDDLPVYRDEQPLVRGVAPSTNGSLPTADGGLRTMCVRTCDGAFFPISANASRQDFSHQADLCAQRCPGAQTELYVHSTTSEESADMVSTVTGAPYTALPTAFAYKNRLPGQKAECGCTMASAPGSGNQARGSQTAPQSTAAYSGIIDLSAKPQAKANAPAVKPGTEPALLPTIAPPAPPAVIAPSAAVASAVPVSPNAPAVATPPSERPYEPDKSKVRIVGPQYLPAEQSSSINLADPAVKGPQPLQQ